MKLSFIIEAVDKASQNMKKITGNVRDLGQRGMGPLARATEMANRRTRGFGRGFSGRLAVMTASAARFAGRAGLMAIERSARAAGRGVMWMVGKAGGLALQGAKWAAAGAGVLGGFFTAGVIGLASQFEQFQVILENTEGSSDRARKAMSWVKDFAETTPYEIDKVMEAFVQLRAYGMDPMNGTMRSLGNMASGMGLDILQAVEMMADAQTGEFERLKTFGIRASKEGEQATFTYVKNGKEIRKTVAMNATAINKAIRDIADDNFAGMMDRQSRTLLGLWRNLKDKFANFQLDIADAGFFDVVKGKLKKLLDWVNELSKNGSLKQWAENISDWMSIAFEKASDFVEKVDWKAVARGAGSIVSTIVGLVEWIGRAQSAYQRFSRQVERRDLQATIDGWFHTEDAKRKARWRMIELDGEEAKENYYSRKNAARGPLLKQPPASRSPKSSSSSQIGGKAEVTVKVEAAAGSKARVTRISSNRPDLTVSAAYRGRAMAGIA